MDIHVARFQREARQRIAGTFPPSRLRFLRALRAPYAFHAFEKIERILGDRERTWHLFLMGLHVLYEAWHELPPLSATERRTLGRVARSLRAIARRLRRRRVMIENDPESTALLRMADEVERIVCPSANEIYNLKSAGGQRIDPRDAIPIVELANLFRQRLAERGFYPVIADLMNAIPGRAVKYNVRMVKSKLDRLKGVDFLPRVQFVYQDPDVVTVKFRDVPALGEVPVSR